MCKSKKKGKSPWVGGVKKGWGDKKTKKESTERRLFRTPPTGSNQKL